MEAPRGADQSVRPRHQRCMTSVLAPSSIELSNKMLSFYLSLSGRRCSTSQLTPLLALLTLSWRGLCLRSRNTERGRPSPGRSEHRRPPPGPRTQGRRRTQGRSP